MVCKLHETPCIHGVCINEHFCKLGFLELCLLPESNVYGTLIIRELVDTLCRDETDIYNIICISHNTF